ncbi:MAG: hypothetical protein NC114_06320 [Ruminococcus flavefaciens]|nr:hypothetical protein [Ruminococcus flavefaciens]
MKQKIGHIVTVVVCCVLITAFVVLGILTCTIKPSNGPDIPYNQIRYDMRNMINNANPTPTLQSVYQEAYYLIGDEDSMRIIFHDNDVTAEVQFDVYGTALGDVQVCMLYDKTKEDPNRFAIYDYGYMPLDK